MEPCHGHLPLAALFMQIVTSTEALREPREVSEWVVFQNLTGPDPSHDLGDCGVLELFTYHSSGPWAWGLEQILSPGSSDQARGYMEWFLLLATNGVRCGGRLPQHRYQCVQTLGGETELNKGTSGSFLVGTESKGAEARPGWHPEKLGVYLWSGRHHKHK